MAEVSVIGAGVIGLAVAWRCAQAGASVTVLDPTPGAGASRVAAGMLAPVTELRFGESPLMQLNVAAAARYPDFVAELEALTGIELGYLTAGTVVAAWDSADLAELRALAALAATLGHKAEILTGRQLRQLVPQLTAGLPGGLLAPEDYQIDNRALHSALLAACHASGVRLRPCRAQRFLLNRPQDAVLGVQTDTGEKVFAGLTVLAAGAWSSRIGGLPDGVVPTVRPVKGQTLRLGLADGPAIGLTVRGSVRGSAVYVVARASGELVVGASSEEAGFDVRPRAGAVYELLRDAQSLLPILAEAEFREVCTGVRPGSPDNAPIIGPSSLGGLALACGHFRHGILLSPITADAAPAWLGVGAAPAVLAPFDPGRFAPVARR